MRSVANWLLTSLSKHRMKIKLKRIFYKNSIQSCNHIKFDIPLNKIVSIVKINNHIERLVSACRCIYQEPSKRPNILNITHAQANAAISIG